ncbi:DUF6630 family protein [Solibacillus sp. FSL K6-1523]|uniref:DUF6630 family protein n=1 Tax=Solibacillus sp. FSL K6-1523 TaxID=2921471 RepID=UPI0030F7B917
MKLFEAIYPSLNEGHKKEVEQLLFDYQKLETHEFIKKQRRFINRTETEEFYIDNNNSNLELHTLIFYLSIIRYVETTDWSGEEYPGQIKRFLHSRLKQYGYSNIKLNDTTIKRKLQHNQVKRGEYIPLLLNCFDNQVRQFGLKIAILEGDFDEYNIALVPMDLFMKMENEVTDCNVTDTNIWSLHILQIGEKRSNAMHLLRKNLDVPLLEVKNFISTLPICVGIGSKRELIKLKLEYELANCIMLLEKYRE